MDRRIAKAIEILKEHTSAAQLTNPTVRCDNPRRRISISELAYRVGLSDAQFRVVFKEATGLSPIEYRRNLEMEQVKKLAEETSLPLSRILEALNVGDESHFRRNFKKVHGITPNRHRKYQPN